MILGIDLGTTNSSVAFLNNDNIPEVIINEKGSRLTPSILYFRNESEVVVGDTATVAGSLEEDRVIRNIKRKIGDNYNVEVFSREYSPSEISSLILRKIKSYSESYLSQELEDVVITVPAYFNHRHRAATKRAGELAGFKSIKIINEPTAALLAYNTINKKNETIVVIDIGGGTFDITIMKNYDGIQKVIATGGDLNLGGIDFDEIIIEIVLKEILNNNNLDIRNDLIAMNQLRLSSKKAKEDLSYLDSTSIVIPYLALTENGPIHLKYELKKIDFERKSKKLLTKIIKIIEDTFNNNKIDFKIIDKVIFIGGTTRIPFIKNEIIKYFSDKMNKKKEDLLPKVTLNPDEAVCLGAAIYGGILEGRINDLEFFDAISHYLGIEEDDGKFAPLIHKNEPYPLVRNKTFTTVFDNQDFIKINILQKRDLDDVNKNLLGYFYLDNLMKMKAGEPDIDVQFSIDRNGILNVSAFDLNSGISKEISINDFTISNEFKNKRRGSKLKVL